MIAVKFEMLSLMTTMNAVGLMPDDDYQLEKERLVKDILDNGSRTVPVNVDDWGDGEEPHLDGNKPYLYHEFDVSERMTFDWKAIISNYLESEFRSQGYFSTGDYRTNLKTEAKRLGVETEFQQSLSGAAFSISELAYARREIVKLQMSGEIDKLREEVRQLRKEVADRSANLRAEGRPSNAEPRISDRSGQIESLQKDLQRLLTAAALSEAKGDAYWAGSHRGEAAKIESKLRALGA